MNKYLLFLPELGSVSVFLIIIYEIVFTAHIVVLQSKIRSWKTKISILNPSQL